MTKHLPPSNILREVTWQPEDFAARPDERFIVVRGRREPYIEDSLMDRAGVIAEIAEDQDYLRQIIAFDITAGTSRDATDDICDVVISRWAEDGKLLTDEQKAWVAMVKGEAFANAFRTEDAA